MTSSNATAGKSAVPVTNGDVVAAVVAAAGEHLRALGAWAIANPDELVIAAAPLVLITAARRGRYLSLSEAFAVSQLAYWAGVLAVGQYRRWKAAPIEPPAPIRIGRPRCKTR